MATSSIRFKVGMTVLINSNETGIGGSVTSYGYKKGDRVELIGYDSYDECWRVRKADTDSLYALWIKRRNLAPLPVVQTPVETPAPRFKIGDKVVLIDKDAAYAKSDNVTTDKEYIVSECSYISIHSNSNYIRVRGNGAGGIFWIETAAFKLSSLVAEPTPNATEPKTMKAVCIRTSLHYSDRLTLGNTYDVQEIEPVGDAYMYFKVLNPDGLGGPFNCWQSRFKVITEPKKRMAVCIDMSSSLADYRVGMTYEITGECAKYFYFLKKSGGMFKWRFKEIVEPIVTAVQTPTPFKVGDLVRLVRFESAIYDKDYFMKQDNLTIGELYEVRSIGNNGQYPANTFIDLKGKTYSHPIDCFELAATAPTSEYTIKVVCNDNNGYEGRLTIGKTYMAKPSPDNDEEETELQRHLYDIESNDKGTRLTTAYCHRFTVVTPPKVGDTVSAQWLNDSTPKQFHGYGHGNSWGSSVNLNFISDRKIEKIEMRDGRMAALLSGTYNIWIDMAELTKPTEAPGKKHVIPDIAKEVPAPVMGMFLMELSTLIQKYK